MFREASGLPFSVTVPTANYRAGDFSGISVNGGAAGAAYLLNLGTTALGAYEGFLFLIGALFVPLLGVLTADYLVVHRSRYTDVGFYPSARAVQPLALVSWMVGIAVYWLIVPPPFLPVNLNLQWLGASLPSFAAAGVSHWTLVRAMARRRARPASAAAP
jgi:purine-cytosine permease-like protein